MTITNLDQLYGHRDIYTSANNTFSPPAERLDHVIRFELTTGCSWGRCTFCNGYNGIPYKVKSLDEYKNHVDMVWETIGCKSDLAKNRRKGFMWNVDDYIQNYVHKSSQLHAYEIANDVWNLLKILDEKGFLRENLRGTSSEEKREIYVLVEKNAELLVSYTCAC